MFCGYCYHSVVFWVPFLSLELHCKDGVLPFYRGSGGAGEAKRFSGWSLCIRVLSQHPGEIQCCHYMGGTPHSKEVSPQLVLHLLRRLAWPRAGSWRLLPGLQERERSALLKTFFFPSSVQTFGLFSKAAESHCGFGCLPLNQMLAVWGW